MKTIDRKGFLKTLGLAGVTAVAAPILIRCGSDDDITDTTTGSSSGSGS